jgi:hypothetical protein
VFLLSFVCPRCWFLHPGQRAWRFSHDRHTTHIAKTYGQIEGRHKRNQIEFSVCRTSLRLPGVLMAVLNETDLYVPVKKLLEEQGYTVRAEVDRCDLLAVRGGEPPAIVELK